MTDAPETIALRVTAIGGIRYADDYQVIWRGPAHRKDHATQWLTITRVGCRSR
jgi:hypothetical protein